MARVNTYEECIKIIKTKLALSAAVLVLGGALLFVSVQTPNETYKEAIETHYGDDANKSADDLSFEYILLSLLTCSIGLSGMLYSGAMYLFAKADKDSFTESKSNESKKNIKPKTHSKKAESKVSFKTFQETLTNQIHAIYQLWVTFKHDDEFADSISHNIEVLNAIKKFTDETEFNKGNIKNLTSYTIPCYLNLLSSYKTLDSANKILADTEIDDNTTQTKTELKDAILKFETIFNNLLKEAIEKESFEADVNASTAITMAQLKGLYPSEFSFENMALKSQTTK